MRGVTLAENPFPPFGERETLNWKTHLSSSSFETTGFRLWTGLAIHFGRELDSVQRR
jgi:hypothetical protein